MKTANPGARMRRWAWSWVLAAVAVVCLCAPLSWGQNSARGKQASELDRQFRAAMAARDAGHLDRAAAMLKELHQKHPGIFAIDESLGLVYAAQGKFAQSVPLLEAAVREQPSSDVAHANLGAAYSKLNRIRDAVREFEIAARLNPQNAETQKALGQLYMAEQKPELAARAFGRAMQHTPNDEDLVLGRARALLEAGKTAEAGQVLKGWPGAGKSGAAQSLLGDISEKAGAYREAGEYYTRAVDLDPSEANVWKLGVEFLRHWTFDAAVREFEAGREKFPESMRMRLGLGAAYFGDGKYALAVPVFADLLESHPDEKLYAELLGMSCTAVVQEARPRCKLLLDYAKAHPRDAVASVYAASGILQGQPNEAQLQLAKKLLQNAVAADPKLPQAQYQMGLLLQNEGDWAGSVPSLERAIALKPNLAEAHYRLGLALWRAGRKDEARAQIALQKKYHKQQQDDLDHRLNEITTFLVTTRK